MVPVAGFPTPEYNKPGLICALHTDGGIVDLFIMTALSGEIKPDVFRVVIKHLTQL